LKLLLFSVLAIAMIGLIFPTAYSLENIQDEQIKWTEEMTLSFSDFKGEPFQDPITDMEEYFSIVGYEPGGMATTWIEFEWTIEQTNYLGCSYHWKVIDATAYFLPHVSWLAPENHTNEILNHELGHFHIAQIIADRFKIVDTAAVCPDGIYDEEKIREETLNMINTQNREMNLLYDIETRGGSIQSKQVEWNKKINHELSRHHEYFTVMYSVDEKSTPDGYYFVDPEDVEEKIEKIPEWVRNIFIWYGEKSISEDEVLNAIKFLINQGIIDLND
jgi:hypothetical protein